MVSAAIGSGVVGASYAGLDVYGTNGRVYAFDGAHNELTIFNPGQSTPAISFDGSTTPAGSIGAAATGSGIAVDQSNGHVYAYDSAHNVVPEFKANGDYITQLSNSFEDGEPSDVAVDNSGGANDGNVYVVTFHAVDAFGGLEPGLPTLSVIKVGPGSGTVSSEPPGIDCGPICEAEFEPGTMVVLMATADPGSTFDPDTGWEGCESVDSEGKCHVTMSESAAVIVTFIKRTLSVSKVGTGAGSVASEPSGIDCGATCEGDFDDGGEVTLTPTEATGSKFTGWGKGDCDSEDGETGACTVTMSSDRQVVARFDSQPIVSEERAGNVTDSSAHLAAGINPEGTATGYYFEYISDADWVGNGESFAGANPAAKAPLAPESIGAGLTPLDVGVAIEGLAPLTTYRFRVVATNLAGTALGELDEANQEIPHTFTTYAPAQLDTDCSNQALRAGEAAHLPDCRAYEQVTPVDKNGGSIQGKVPLARASLAGDAFSFESPAGIPGGTGAQEFPTYVGKRGAGGWSTSGLLPDASTGQSAKWLGWSPDFSQVFDEVFKYGQGIGLIARSTVDGSERTIVPYTMPLPQYSYVGSSDDGATVVFEARDQSKTTLALAPGAAPGMPNVYAWAEDNPGVIRTAGVLPDGSTPAEGSRSVKAGEYAVDLHLVAADGSVYFTDRETGKLYLRLNPTAAETTEQVGGSCVPDAALACTIPISASQKENGNGVGKHDAAGSQPADFMAATPDGGSAFLLSSEKLTDDATTGPEPSGSQAIARAAKVDGSGKDPLFLTTAAHNVAIDEAEGYAYWTDPEHGQIGRAKLDGTEPDPSYITGLGEPQGIAVIDQGSDKYLFWTERGELSSEGKAQAGLGSIGRADLDGSNVKGDCVTGITNPRSIAAAAGHIYWTMPGITEAEIKSGKGTTGSAELTCTAVEANLIKGAVDLSGDIVVGGAHIYVSSYAKAFDESFVYQFEIDGSGPAFHGNFPINLSNTEGAASLAVDGSHLYWANPGTSEIGRSGLDGSGQEPGFITEAGHPEDLGVDGAFLYWPANQQQVANDGVDLYRYDRSDGKLHDLAVDHGDPNGAEVQGVAGVSRDGSFVYFVANGIPDGVGNSPNGEGESAQLGNCAGGGDSATGVCNLYAYHDGAVDFIARLDANGSGIGGIGNEGGSSDAENWVRGRGELGKVESDKTARVSDDGRVLVFRSVRPLTGYDNDGPICGRVPGSGEKIPGHCTEFYRFSYDDKGLACISCDPRGEAATGPARIASIRPGGLGAVPGTAVLSRNLSTDGNRFFFETTDALVARDVNGEEGCAPWGGAAQKLTALSCQDVYEWEAPAPGTSSCKEDSPAFSTSSGGCIYLISSGRSAQASFFGDASAGGDDVFIFTYDRLAGQDEDSLLDVYDARAGGGLATQNQAKATPCSGEACKSPPPPPPPAEAPGSSSFSGPGNQPVKHAGKHRKHKKRKHAKHRRRRSGKKHRGQKHSGKKHRGYRNTTAGRAGR